MKKIIVSVVFFASLLSTTFYYGCKKEDDLNPEEWAPQNFWVEDIGFLEKELTWDYYGPGSLDGFKIDRKAGNEDWEIPYQTFPKETRTWNDTNIVPVPPVFYSYRIYAFKGNSTSANQTISSKAIIQPISNLTAYVTSPEVSAIVLWKDNCSGEDGFKIDRKVDDNDWLVAYGIVEANDTSFVDTNIYRSITVKYRVYAYTRNYESQKKTTTLFTELPEPTKLINIRNSLLSTKLSWDYEHSFLFDGFKIERKYEGDDWKQIATTKAYNYIDNNFELNTTIYYRVCAFIGEYISPYDETNFDATIPAPTDLEIEINVNPISATLSWQDNSTGEEGFKIERKIDGGTWALICTTIENTEQYEDETIILEECVEEEKYYYKVYSYYSSYNSDFSENTIDRGIIVDSRDGRKYGTVIINGQCWMNENLAWLPNVSPSSNGSQTLPHYYVYGYEGSNVIEAKTANNYQKFGVLYNWPAVLNACPSADGWHLPDEDEWMILIEYLGGANVAGGKMKEAGLANWASPNSGATNSSKFIAMPGGFRNGSGNFNYSGYYGTWWSVTESGSAKAWSPSLSYNEPSVGSSNNYKYNGFSVRCIKDN